jgi:hypothetical protein
MPRRVNIGHVATIAQLERRALTRARGIRRMTADRRAQDAIAARGPR